MWVEILQYNYKERLLNIGGYLQMATHFRNSYEVAGPEENEKYVEVLVQAGRYAISTYNMKLSQWFSMLLANWYIILIRKLS